MYRYRINVNGMHPYLLHLLAPPPHGISPLPPTTNLTNNFLLTTKTSSYASHSLRLYMCVTVQAHSQDFLRGVCKFEKIDFFALRHMRQCVFLTFLLNREVWGFSPRKFFKLGHSQMHSGAFFY